MILDDLFNFAAQNSSAIRVLIQANVTTNQTGGLLTEQTNTAAAPPACCCSSTYPAGN
jgi:hypothetical protein